METIYRQLQRKFNTLGLGLPESDAGYELNYLAELFTEEEAEFALKMDRGLHTPAEFAQSLGISEEEAAQRLESMAARSNIFRIHDGDQVKYSLFPIIHGFLEFTIDRFNDVIAKNFGKHYMKGVGARFYGAKEPLFRILPVRPDIVEEGCLPCDDIEAIIRKQTSIALTPCFCRTSANSSPKAKGCSHNPDYSELCMVMGIFADFYLENGNARKISVEEALEHYRKCDEEGNVIEVLNTNDVEVMCSCCTCCCGVLKALQFFGGPGAQFASNYKASLDPGKCVGCGLCESRCPMNCLSFSEDGAVQMNPANCIGCGLCATVCPSGALTIHQKPEDQLYHPPKDSVIELYDHITRLRRKEGAI